MEHSGIKAASELGRHSLLSGYLALYPSLQRLPGREKLYRGSVRCIGVLSRGLRVDPGVASNRTPPRKADGERRAFLCCRGDLYLTPMSNDDLAHDV